MKNQNGSTLRSFPKPFVSFLKTEFAVTHVLMRDQTSGYGIFIENMLAEAEKNK
ncbi:MAG: hypothetical protein E7613_10590 [Ruminococcaceae bacterium]|nr:hypothetical protein [Oscillospiraceae bacterium]